MRAERFGADAGRTARIVLFATAASFVIFCRGGAAGLNDTPP